MKRLFLVLICFITCSGFSWLNTFLSGEETEEEIVEIVVENQEEIEPTIEKTSEATWDETSLTVPQDGVSWFSYGAKDDYYKIRINVRVGESMEQFMFWGATANYNGYDDSKVIEFGDSWKINTKYLKDSNQRPAGILLSPTMKETPHKQWLRITIAIKDKDIFDNCISAFKEHLPNWEVDVAQPNDDSGLYRKYLDN